MTCTVLLAPRTDWTTLERSTDPQVENWGDTWLYNETALSDTTKVLVAMTIG